MKSIIISLLICLCCFPMHLSSQDLTIEEQWERELEAEKAKQKKRMARTCSCEIRRIFCKFYTTEKTCQRNDTSHGG